MISRSQLSVFQKAAPPPHSFTVAPPILTGLVPRQAVYTIPENPLALLCPRSISVWERFARSLLLSGAVCRRNRTRVEYLKEVDNLAVFYRVYVCK